MLLRYFGKLTRGEVSGFGFVYLFSACSADFYPEEPASPLKKHLNMHMNLCIHAHFFVHFEKASHGEPPGFQICFFAYPIKRQQVALLGFGPYSPVIGQSHRKRKYLFVLAQKLKAVIGQLVRKGL